MSTANTVIAVSSSSSHFFLGNSFSHAFWNKKTLRLHIFSWFLVSIRVEIQKQLYKYCNANFAFEV